MRDELSSEVTRLNRELEQMRTRVAEMNKDVRKPQVSAVAQLLARPLNSFQAWAKISAWGSLCRLKQARAKVRKISRWNMAKTTQKATVFCENSNFSRNASFAKTAKFERNNFAKPRFTFRPCLTLSQSAISDGRCCSPFRYAKGEGSLNLFDLLLQQDLFVRNLPLYFKTT